MNAVNTNDQKDLVPKSIKITPYLFNGNCPLCRDNGRISKVVYVGESYGVIQHKKQYDVSEYEGLVVQNAIKDMIARPLTEQMQDIILKKIKSMGQNYFFSLMNNLFPQYEGQESSIDEYLYLINNSKFFKLHSHKTESIMVFCECRKGTLLKELESQKESSNG